MEFCTSEVHRDFSKEVQIEGPKEMEIGDFKYRNGVLTLRIKTSEAL